MTPAERETESRLALRFGGWAAEAYEVALRMRRAASPASQHEWHRLCLALERAARRERVTPKGAVALAAAVERLSCAAAVMNSFGPHPLTREAAKALELWEAAGRIPMARG